MGHGRAQKRAPVGRFAKTVFRNGEYHLTADQLRRLVEAAVSDRDRAIVQLLAETGLRRGELASLEIADIDADQPLLTVLRGKGGKVRQVPITPTLHRRLLNLCGDLSSGSIFRSAAGQTLSLRQVNRVVAQAGERAGLTNPNPRHRQITCHLLRHSFARVWKDAGGSVESLSKILGHSSIKTTMDVYGTESLIDVQRNYERMMGRQHKSRQITTQQPTVDQPEKETL